MATVRYLNLDNNLDVSVRALKRRTADSERIGATSLTVTAWLAAAPGGNAIHASLTITLAARASLSGGYTGAFDRDLLKTHVASYAKVYLIVDATGTQKGRITRELTVRAVNVDESWISPRL